MYQGLSGKLWPSTAAAVCASLTMPMRQIGLGQALSASSTWRVVWYLRDDAAEAVDRAGVVALLEIVAADLHLLAGELVARDLDLLAGVVAYSDFG